MTLFCNPLVSVIIILSTISSPLILYDEIPFNQIPFHSSPFPLPSSHPSILPPIYLSIYLFLHFSLIFSFCSLFCSVRLWNDKADWAKLRQKILDSPMSELDVVMLERELTKSNKTMFLASKGLPNNKVVTKLKLSLEEFNPVLPLGTYVLSSSFRQSRHILHHFSLLLLSTTGNILYGFRFLIVAIPLSFPFIIF